MNGALTNLSWGLQPRNVHDEWYTSFKEQLSTYVPTCTYSMLPLYYIEEDFKKRKKIPRNSNFRKDAVRNLSQITNVHLRAHSYDHEISFRDIFPIFIIIEISVPLVQIEFSNANLKLTTNINKTYIERRSKIDFWLKSSTVQFMSVVKLRREKSIRDEGRMNSKFVYLQNLNIVVLNFISNQHAT